MANIGCMVCLIFSMNPSYSLAQTLQQVSLIKKDKHAISIKKLDKQLTNAIKTKRFAPFIENLKLTGIIILKRSGKKHVHHGEIARRPVIRSMNGQDITDGFNVKDFTDFFDGTKRLEIKVQWLKQEYILVYEFGKLIN